MQQGSKLCRDHGSIIFTIIITIIVIAIIILALHTLFTISVTITIIETAQDKLLVKARSSSPCIIPSSGTWFHSGCGFRDASMLHCGLQRWGGDLWKL